MPNFKDKVLEIVREIPKGKVVSYGQVALMAGIPGAAVIVGGIMHNHGSTTPWWRVINNIGYIKTAFVEKNKNKQKVYLARDGIPVDKNLWVDIEKYRWRPDPKTLQGFELSDEYIQKFIEKYLF